MNEAQIVIIILTVIGSVFAFYIKLKNDIIKEQEKKSGPIENLNKSIIQLNSTIGFLTQMIETLKNRVTIHGSEIDEIRLQTERQEERIKILEKHCNDMRQ